MKLVNLKYIYFYSPEEIKIDGETQKKWKYKDKKRLNKQDDINELDRNSAGTIDYDRTKLLIDYDINLNKGDGVSLKELEIKDGYTIEPPQYVVIAKPSIGKKTTFTCEIYHGE